MSKFEVRIIAAMCFVIALCGWFNDWGFFGKAVVAVICLIVALLMRNVDTDDYLWWRYHQVICWFCGASACVWIAVTVIRAMIS